MHHSYDPVTVNAVACLQEAKSRMASAGVVPRTLALLARNCPPALQVAALRLLTNLAFDTRMRRRMVAEGLVQRLTGLLPQQPTPNQAQASVNAQTSALMTQLQPLALGLLYLASMEEAGQKAFADTELVPRSVQS